MQDSLRKQLQVRVDYCKTLEKDFHNNLQVIEEREAQIQELNHQLKELQDHNDLITNQLNEVQQQSEMEIRILHGEYQQKIEEKERETEELTVMIEGKLRKEIQIVTNRLNGEIKKLKKQLTENDQCYRRVLNENNRQQEIIKDQKTQLLDLQTKLQALAEEKNSYAHKMSLHLQELDSVKSCQQSWQDTLKGKVKQSQSQKQKLQEQLSDIKMTFRQKLKRQKQEFSKKILQMAEEKERQLKEKAIEQRQMRYKLQKIINQNKEMSVEIQFVREENRKNQNMINKYKQNDMKSNFDKNQKEYDMLQKMFDQNARDLKNQIQNLTQDKKSMKEEIDQANNRRQAVQKAVERLKIELLNKSKEVDELKKENRKQKHQMQQKCKQFEANQGYREEVHTNKKFDIVQSAKFQNNQYSKVYTEDLGVIDDKFFEPSSPMRSPKHAKNTHFQSNMMNREAQLMKKVSQLQLQNQQFKHLIKSLREEAESMKRICEQDKNREIALYRDKANIYWQKANDKEQQLVSLRQQYNDLKNIQTVLTSEMKILKEKENKFKERETDELKMKQLLAKAEAQNKELEEEVVMLQNQRKMLEDVSAELRSEIHSLKQMINTNIEYQEGQDSQEDSQYTQTAPYQGQYQRNIQNTNYLHQQTAQREERPRQDQRKLKIPKKLHDLVREKKTLSISGKQATIGQKALDVRLEHVGTDSQKEIYQKIKVKAKTPPKAPNYAQLKQKQRRTQVLQTASQKQAFERLRSRNLMSPERGPDRGVNYLQMRSQQYID